MWWTKNPGGKPLEGFKTVELTCPKCHNRSDHVPCAFPVGVAIGLPFYYWSLKKRYLVCPICHNPTKELTKSEVTALGPKL